MLLAVLCGVASAYRRMIEMTGARPEGR